MSIAETEAAMAERMAKFMPSRDDTFRLDGPTRLNTLLYAEAQGGFYEEFDAAGELVRCGWLPAVEKDAP